MGDDRLTITSAANLISNLFLFSTSTNVPAGRVLLPMMSGSEDEMMMELDDVPQRNKKFTFRSYEAQLQDVHAPSRVAPLIAEHNIEDDESHFQVSLEQWRQLNLSPNFVSFANRASSLSGSLPMLLHHWEEVVSLWVDAVGASDDEGLKPMIELSTCLMYDLRQTLLPVAPQILESLLSLLPRKLPPDSLELLLTALTTHLKYLVIANPPLLESTWSAYLNASSGSSQPSHVRMLAEVWGHLLRKLKKPEKERAAQLLVTSLDKASDFVTWCVVEATRAKQAQGIYTTATDLIGPILDAHVGGSSGTYVLLRRVLTALIHHSKTESFAGIAGVVVAILERELAMLESESKGKGKAKEHSETVSEQEDRLVRVVEIATAMCAVRKGGKLSRPTVSSILTAVPRIFTCSEKSRGRPEYRALIVSALMAGDMGSWIGPGRHVLDSVWKEPLEGMRLSAILSELGWGGWKSMMLQHVLRRTPETLASNRSQCLSVLATLYKSGHLEVDAVWTARVGSDIADGLRKWNVGDSNKDLISMLALSPILPGAATGVARIVSLLHGAQTNASSLGASIRALVDLEGAETALRNETELSLLALVERWWWSQSVMGALPQFQTLLAPISAEIPLSNLFPHLLTPLTSHSHTLRSSALQVLAGPCVTRSSTQTTALSRIVAAENVPLTIQGSRERVVNTRKIVNANGAIEGDDMYKIAVRWLVAQLKVNLRPLWAPAIQTLGTLASESGCGEEVWNVVYSELERVCRYPSAFELRSPKGDDNEENNDRMEVDVEADLNGEWEEAERTWRCPVAIKFIKAVKRWEVSTVPSLEEPTPQDRLDLANYESQLLLALGGMPSLMDRHTRDLVPLFFDYASPTAPSRPPRAKTMSWLTLLSKLNNPKAAFRSQELHALYTTLLSHPDRPLQSLTLTCLLTFRESHVLAVEQSLRLFLDETKWRDEMTGFSFESLDGELRARAVGVTIRLLYGTMLEKNRRDKKSAVLTLFSGCSPQELGTLVRLMLAPFEDCLGGELENAHTAAGGKQRTGFLTFLADVIKNLGPKLLDYWPQLLRTTMVLLRDAQAHCKSSIVPVEEELDESEEPTDEHTLRQARSIRQLGLKRFIDFFRSAVAESFDFSSYLPVAFQWFVSPRVPLLARENTQAPSGILDLFYTWSMEPRTTLYLVEYDPEVLPQVFNCLTAVNVKPVVVSRVFDILEALLEHSEVDEGIKSRVVAPHTSHLLVQLSAMVERSSTLTTTTDLVQRQLRILCQVAPYISDESQATRLLFLLSPMLRRPAKMVSEKVKVDLLGIVKNTFPFVHALKDPSSDAYRMTYELLSSMFQSLRTRPGRVTLVEVFAQLAKFNEALVPIAHIVIELNAYSTKRMNEPNFDRRLTAFGSFNEEGYKSLGCELWLPVIYNMLYFIQDPEELSIRSSASLSLKRFVEEVAVHPSSDFEKTFTKVLYPGLRYALRSKFELVRTEILSVIAHAVARCDSISSLSQLRPLLADGDDEANFFLNVYHIQTHRRTRALRRLADFAENIRSTTLSDLFMPLVGQFVESVATTDHLLVNEAISTLGRMAAQLAWGSYNAAVQYYLRLARERVPTTEKAMIRTVVSILDNFHFKMGESVEVEKPEAEEGVEPTETSDQVEAEAKTNAQREAKKMARIEEAVTTRLLPSLLQYLEKRDEVEEAIRIPVAIGIARVTMHLPDSYRGPQISKLIIALSQILRSKSQDVRDLTRETLCKIAIIVGPESLSLLIKELRGALTRGPQLHVLAFVTHSILVHVTTGDHAPRFSVLDDSVSDIAHISAEVVFGQSGKDVQAEGFKTKMKEVRSSASKGLDSFMIIAKFITAARVVTLLVPIRSIMHETVAIKPMQQVEDVLRRIAGGLNANANLRPTDTIGLCHTLISQNAKFLKQKPAKKQYKKKTDFDVDLKRDTAPEADFYASNSFRFIVFGLEILVTGFRRGRFDYADPDVISRLEPITVVIGNTLYSQDGHVVTLGLKAAASIVKCPLRSVDKSLPVFVKQTLEIIRSSGGTESEVTQTALKSLAIMIRDCPAAKLQESDLTFLLEVIAPDLEEPERQAAVFSLLRAIIARKFVVPEIYDLMGKVAEILVTNQSPQVQELARSVLLQFLLDYPQGKGRLRTQLNALARNLDYVFDSGRKSVMEFLAAVFSKFTDTIIDEYADMFFVALVLRIANDDSTKCREMAAALIQQLLGRVAEDRCKKLMVHVHNWAKQEEKQQLAGVAAQVYGLTLDALHAGARPFVSDMVTDLRGLVQRSAYTLSNESDGMDVDEDDKGATWQVAYHSLTALVKLYREFPELLHSASHTDWVAIYSHLLFPHAWVRLASCRLVGLLFASVPISPDNLSLGTDLAETTIAAPAGTTIALTSLVDVTQKLCLQLRSIHLDETLSTQVVKNLFYVGKVFTLVYAQAKLGDPADQLVDEDVEDESGTESDPDNEEDHTENRMAKALANPLAWMFSKLSYQARSAHIARVNRAPNSSKWYVHIGSIFRWFAAMASHLPAPTLEAFLPHILAPVYRIAEEDAIKDTELDDLKTLVHELQDLLQQRTGTTAFANAYSRIRQGVVRVRRERKIQRATQAATHPEAAARRKLQRNMAKKEGKKRKDRAFADGKIRNNAVKKRRRTGDEEMH